MGTAMLDDEKNNRENGPLTRSILSSTYINFLFGAGVNSVALPQLYGFNKTIEQIKNCGGDCTNGLEAGIDSINDPVKREAVKKAFMAEFKYFHSVVNYDSEPIHHIEKMLRITYQFAKVAQNRNPGMKQINIYTLNYDEIMEHVLSSLGYLYHQVSSSNTDRMSSLMNIIGYDYITKKYVPSFMISKLHGGIDNPIIPGKFKYHDVLTAEYFEIAFNMKQHLLRPNSILFVLGYSRGDEHINEIIRDCINSGLTVYWYRYNDTEKLPKIFDPESIIVIDQPDPDKKQDATLIYYQNVKKAWEEKFDE